MAVESRCWIESPSLGGEVQNLSLVVSLLADDREFRFQRRPVSRAAIHNLLKLCRDDEKAVHFDFAFSEFRQRADRFLLAQGIEAIAVPGQTSVMQPVWIEKTNTDGFVAAVARPKDKVRVKTTVNEKPDAHFRHVAQQVEVELAVAFFLPMNRPEGPQVLHKLPLILA